MFPSGARGSERNWRGIIKTTKKKRPPGQPVAFSHPISPNTPPCACWFCVNESKSEAWLCVCEKKHGKKGVKFPQIKFRGIKRGKAYKIKGEKLRIGGKKLIRDGCLPKPNGNATRVTSRPCY